MSKISTSRLCGTLLGLLAGSTVLADVSGLPEGTVLHADIAYAGNDNPRQTLHLLVPETVEAPVPVVISIHGGGWEGGSKDHALGLLAPHVARGDFALVAPAYRFTDEAVWPAQLDDVEAAHRWLLDHGQEFGLDAERVGLYGVSAGGHLALMLATDPDLGIDGVVSVAGPTDFLTIADDPARFDHDAAGSISGKLIGGRLSDHPDRARSASPLSHIDGDEPAHMLIHGDLDGIIPFSQSVRLDQALDQAGVPSVLVRVASARHGPGLPWSGIGTMTAEFFTSIFARKPLPFEDGTVTPRLR